MIRLDKSLYRRLDNALVIGLHATHLSLLRTPHSRLTPLRRNLHRETKAFHYGSPIVVDLDPKSISLRLKGARAVYELTYTRLATELSNRAISVMRYTTLFELMKQREESAERTRQFVERHTA